MAWIGVDLDGTLAGWGDPHPTDVLTIGPPIAPMVARVKQMLAEGREVRIFTARVGPATKAECHAALCERGYPAHPEYDPVVHDPEHFFLADQRRLIEAWCVEHLGQVLPITATKDFHMVALYDDRCLQVVSNQGVLVQDGAEAYGG